MVSFSHSERYGTFLHSEEKAEFIQSPLSGVHRFLSAKFVCKSTACCILPLGFNEVPHYLAKPDPLGRRLVHYSPMLGLPGCQSASCWFDSELAEILELVVEEKVALEFILLCF